MGWPELLLSAIPRTTVGTVAVAVKDGPAVESLFIDRREAARPVLSSPTVTFSMRLLKFQKVLSLAAPGTSR